MNPAQWRKTRDLFDAALELEPVARDRFLTEACAADAELRAQVEQLLLDDAHDDFLERPLLLDAAQIAAADELAHLINQRIDDYHIVSEIGRGGMGVVFLAERADYQQQVAIKLLWPGVTTPETTWRFNQERRILARLNHPNIARLLDGGITPEGWQYVVMEYVAGQRITDYCRQRTLPVIERLKLFQQICTAVEYAHHRLIVHRDLKPANILVTDEGQIKLLDFGIAKLLDPSLLELSDEEAAPRSRTGLQPMTPEYASPEQIRNETITTASDIYILGVLLYELLTGVHPHRLKKVSLHELTRLICEEEPKLPSLMVRQAGTVPGAVATGSVTKLAAQLRGDLDNIALKALRKQPQQRYASVSDFSQDITRHLNGEPVMARTATLPYRLSRYLTRHKTGVAMTAFVALTILSAALYFLRQSQIAQAQVRAQQRELYAADMRQAGSDWHEGNLVQMDELLERHRPGNGIDDEWRGFEWFALWKLLHREKFTLHHQVATPSAIYSSDDRIILTGERSLIRKWDARSGQSLGVFSYLPSIRQMSFFKSGNRLLVNGGATHKFSIWDYLGQKKLLEISPFSPFDRDDFFHAISPDETKLLISLSGRQFQLWDMNTGQLLQKFTVPADLAVPPDGPAIYTPDGRPLCLTRRNNHLELWDLAAQRSVVQLDPQSDDPRALLPYYPVGHVLSPDGTRYYLPTQDYKIRVWDFKRGGKPIQILSGHENQIETPALSHDGRLLASGSDDRTLRLWDTETGKLLTTIKNESQTLGPVFSGDGRYLLALSMRALRTKAWNVQALISDPQSTENFQTLDLSSTQKLLTYDEKKGMALRSLNISQSQHMYGSVIDSSPPSMNYDSFQFSPDEKMIATREISPQSGSISHVVVRDLPSGEVLTQIGGSDWPANAVRFSPDGKMLAVGSSDDGAIRLWDTTTWLEIKRLHNPVKDFITTLDFSPNGKWLATGGFNGLIKIIDVTRGVQLVSLGDQSSWIMKVRFSPDGTLLATANWDFTIRLWNPVNGQPVRTLRGHANTVYGFAFSPDGRRLASGSDDRTVRLWDLETGKELTSLRGHTGKVWQVFFTPDGQTLISSGEDGTRIWRTATTEEVLQHPRLPPR